MIKSFPFDGQVTRVEEITAPGEQKVQVPVLDRAWSSEDLQEFDSYFFTDGISQRITDCFKVSVATGMQLSVKPGFALISGARMVSDAVETVTIDAADPSQARIDTVVLRKDNSVPQRSCGIYVVKGTPGANPQPVSPVRTSELYELVIAQVKVRAGTTSIATYDITDTRLKSALCGIMTPVPGVDTTGIFDQYQAALDEFLDLVDAAISGTMLEEVTNRINDVRQKIYKVVLKPEDFMQASAIDASSKKYYSMTIVISDYMPEIEETDIVELRAGNVDLRRNKYSEISSKGLSWQQYTELLSIGISGKMYKISDEVDLVIQAFKKPTIEIPIYIVITTPVDKGEVTPI